MHRDMCMFKSVVFILNVTNLLGPLLPEVSNHKSSALSVPDTKDSRSDSAPSSDALTSKESMYALYLVAV